jgi:hypothetical protein
MGSVLCEHSFSALRRLKQWNRTTMVEDRLNELALFAHSQSRDVNVDGQNTRQILAMSDVVIVTIVRGTSLDARNMSVLSAGKRWSNCKRQWSMNGKKTFTNRKSTSGVRSVKILKTDPNYYQYIRGIFHILLTMSIESSTA